MKRNIILFVLLPILLSLTVSIQNSCNTDNVDADGKSFTAPIVIYGDSRTDNATHLKVIEAIAGIDPKIVFSTGDLVAESGSTGWNGSIDFVSSICFHRGNKKERQNLSNLLYSDYNAKKYEKEKHKRKIRKIRGSN